MKNFIYNARNLKILVLLFVLVSSFVFTTIVQAKVDLTAPLESAGKGIYGGEPPATDMPTIIGNVIKVVLGLVGIIMVIIVVYAGYLWMTAGGESDQVKKAKDWMLNATIGILICLVAYTLSTFVVGKIIESTMTP